MSTTVEKNGIRTVAAGHAPTLKVRKRPLGRRATLALSIASPVVLLLLWELASRSGMVDAEVLPPPPAESSWPLPRA